MWTAQEAVLPSKAVVHIGEHKADLQLFLQATNSIWKFFNSDYCYHFIAEDDPLFLFGWEEVGVA